MEACEGVGEEGEGGFKRHVNSVRAGCIRHFLSFSHSHAAGERC